MLVSPTVSKSPRPTQKEKAVFVFPEMGTGQARTTLTHPGPSPAVSKVLESFAESDLSYRGSGIQLVGGWGSVSETAQDLDPELTHIGGSPPVLRVAGQNFGREK